MQRSRRITIELPQGVGKSGFKDADVPIVPTGLFSSIAIFFGFARFWAVSFIHQLIGLEIEVLIAIIRALSYKLV